ncbi:MAG: hypothetical protein HYV07_01995, partial [Deltaproteobacteria bacterium]|nr:hypothetical protein [Deltaproteobacteria bacterium]
DLAVDPRVTPQAESTPKENDQNPGKKSQLNGRFFVSRSGGILVSAQDDNGSTSHGYIRFSLSRRKPIHNTIDGFLFNRHDFFLLVPLGLSQ